MRLKLAGIIATATLALSFAGCSQTTNENANARANANANVMVNENANANANANISTKRAPTRADYEKNKETYAQEAKTLGQTIGTGLDDGWLWTKTRFDLAAADDLKDSTINVDVQSAIVTLRGTVDNPQQKAKAETIAKAVAGVKSVKNMLTVTTNKTATANSNVKKK